MHLSVAEAGWLGYAFAYDPALSGSGLYGGHRVRTMGLVNRLDGLHLAHLAVVVATGAAAVYAGA